MAPLVRARDRDGRRLARASARAALSHGSAWPARVKTDRLWSGSRCRSSRAWPGGVGQPARKSWSRPSLTLTTHSMITAPAVSGVAGRAGATARRRPERGRALEAPGRYLTATACERRRRRRMRRRSRSEAPPHTPWSMWFSSAYSRQGSETGHSAQIRWATSTPIPSLGKKMSGATSLHFPRAIQSVFIVRLPFHASFYGRCQSEPGFAHRKFVRIQSPIRALPGRMPFRAPGLRWRRIARCRGGCHVPGHRGRSSRRG